MSSEMEMEKLLANTLFWAARRERCPEEVVDYLREKGANEATIIHILETLEKEGYVDVMRFARAFVHDKFRFNQWGRVRLRMELRRRRIPEDQAGEALEVISEEDYYATLDKLLSDKLKHVKGSDRRTTLHKITTFAIGKGFEPALVRERAIALIP